jgi:hypothetical protein
VSFPPEVEPSRDIIGNGSWHQQMACWSPCQKKVLDDSALSVCKIRTSPEGRRNVTWGAMKVEKCCGSEIRRGVNNGDEGSDVGN